MPSEAAMCVKSGRDEAGAVSPRNKMKFLCSHGGRILPRPVDGNLKYVGGETRVVALSHHVTFLDVMRKLREIFPGDVVLKYQILCEDLDTLVSVRSDEDLKHMIDEYERHKNEGTPKLRTFLFPAKPIVAESHLALMDASSLDQRYIDAINGITHTAARRRRPSTHANSISSACPSPKSTSPDACQDSPVTPERALPKRLSMYKVHSSPSLYNLGNAQGTDYSNNQMNSSTHQHHNQQHQCHHLQGFQSPHVRVALEPHKPGLPPWMLPAAVPMDRPPTLDLTRFYVGQTPNYYYSPNIPQIWNAVGGGGGGGNNIKYYDDTSLYSQTPQVRTNT